MVECSDLVPNPDNDDEVTSKVISTTTEGRGLSGCKFQYLFLETWVSWTHSQSFCLVRNISRPTSVSQLVDSVLKEAVQIILVVDPNKGVLKLFCRSRVTTLATRAFGIILVEQRLVSRCDANRQREREAVGCCPQSSSALTSLRASEEVSEKPTSFSHLYILTRRNHSRTFAPQKIGWTKATATDKGS